MTSGMGSADNPVRLDPFRRIKEVGWGGKYLAFSLFVTRTATDEFPETGTSPNLVHWPWNWATQETTDPELPQIPDSTYIDSWVAAFQYGLENAVTSGELWRHNRGWRHGVGISSVSGLPTLPQRYDFGPFEYAAELLIGSPPVAFLPQAEWVAPAGDAFVDPDGEDITVPGLPDLHFAVGDTATIQMRGRAFIVGPGSYRSGVGGGAYIAETSPGVFEVLARDNDIAQMGEINAATFAALDFPLSTMRLTAVGRTWQPVAFAATGPNTIGESPYDVLDPGMLWVLCQKYPPPTPGP